MPSGSPQSRRGTGALRQRVQMPLENRLLEARLGEARAARKEVGRDLRGRDDAHAVPPQEIGEATQRRRLAGAWGSREQQRQPLAACGGLLALSVTVKLNAPMRAEPSPNATARLEFKLHQVVLTGKNMRPVHHTPIEALGLEMDDDAPGDEDEHLGLQDGERLELRVGA